MPKVRQGRVTKATSLAGPRRLGSRKNLICGVCHEVYRSPRILSCFHTFCLHCLEELICSPDGRYRDSFPCPSCQKPTAVPPDGALGFQMNVYITEDELATQRKGSVCPNHEAEKELLGFFCIQCDQAVCFRCALTTHMNHKMQDLSKAAARCHTLLDASKDKLEEAIGLLTTRNEGAYENLRAAKEKGKLIKEEIQQNCDMLVARVHKYRDVVLVKTEHYNKKTEQQLSKNAHDIQHQLDSLLQLRQRINHTLGEEGADAEKVKLEREMRDGQGSADKLIKEARANILGTTKRTGLSYDQSSISVCDIQRFLGSPQELSLPWETSVTDIIYPFFQCGKEGEFREVHNVHHLKQHERTYVSYGGHVPNKAAGEKFAVFYNVLNTLYEKECVLNNLKVRLTFKKHSSPSVHGGYQFYTGKSTGGVYAVQKNYQVVSVRDFCIPRTFSGELSAKTTKSYEVKVGNALAFDACRSWHVFVVEKKDRSNSKKAERSVLLYTVMNGEMVWSSTYTPPYAGFYPADVCFWWENKRQKILVADTKNDCVHVVRTEKDGCHFERYLAAGNARLIHPTALGVDEDNGVWIGCSNGWILKCETIQPRNNEIETADIACSDAATSQISRLVVENASVSTSASPTIQSHYDEMETAANTANCDAQPAGSADLRLSTDGFVLASWFRSKTLYLSGDPISLRSAL